MFRLYLAFLLIALSLHAQDRAAINGTVTDASGALAPGASVELNSTETGLGAPSVSDDGGRYQITPLPVGTYSLTIIKPGFKPTTVNHIELQYGETRTIDARLEVGRANDSVEVVATAEAVNRNNAEVGAVIEPQQIKEIPVSGRNWASLILLAPGAVNYGDGSQRSIRFAGHSLDDSNFTFDGMDTSGVQEQTQKADTRLNIALDSIAEFRVSTSNYTAESGAAGGAQINVVSKTGTNQYPRQHVLRGAQRRAGCALAVRRRHPAALHPAPVRRQLRRRDREGQGVLLRQLRGPAAGSGPDVYQLRAERRLPRAGAGKTSPVLKPIIDAYPLGQTRVDDVTDQVNLVASDTIREDAGMFRFDYRFNNNNTAFCPLQRRQRLYRQPDRRAGRRTTWSRTFRPTWCCNTSGSFLRRPRSTRPSSASIAPTITTSEYGTSPVAVSVPGPSTA